MLGGARQCIGVRAGVDSTAERQETVARSINPQASVGILFLAVSWRYNDVVVVVLPLFGII